MKVRLDYTRRSKKFPSNFQPFLQQAKQYGISSTQRKIMGGIKPDNAPLTKKIKRNGKTLRDRGIFLASITGKVIRYLIEVGTNFPPAKILHNGGIIRPKKAKFLYIPAGAKTRTMMRRYGSTPGRCIKGMKAAGYSVWHQGMVVMARRKGGQPYMLFIKKKSVKIPARKFLFLDKTDREVIWKMLREYCGFGRK